MYAFLARRFLMAIPVTILMSAVTFAIFFVLPGDPAAAILGAGERVVDPEQYQRLRQSMGLERPIHVQYASWLSNALQGDMGASLRTQRAVTEAIWQRIPITLELTLLAMGVAALIGVTAGIVTAIRAGSPIDHLGTLVSLAGVAMPNFWFGVLLIYAFSIYLDVLPAAGYVRFTQDPVDNLRHMVMPTLVVALPAAAAITRHTRSALLTVLRDDYVTTAHAKGLSPRRVIVRHALRNALLPILTVIGVQVGELFGGAIIAESIFGIPGIGGLLLESITFRDFPVVQSLVLLLAVVVLMINSLTDVFYAFLDPRIRFR